jgi:hypothetical protein
MTGNNPVSRFNMRNGLFGRDQFPLIQLLPGHDDASMMTNQLSASGPTDKSQ